MHAFCAVMAYAQGMEVAVTGYATQFERCKPFPDVSHMGVGVRLSLDAEWSLGHRDQFQVSLTPGRRTDAVDYQFYGAGYSVCALTGNEGWFAALGSEIRYEVLESKWLGLHSGVSSTCVRPWVMGTLGFKGLFFPLPGFEIANYYLTSSRKLYPFTRMELAYPCWRQGGEGVKGALARTANCPQIGLQLGLRF